jgi:hypothetical protein
MTTHRQRLTAVSATDYINEVLKRDASDRDQHELAHDWRRFLKSHFELSDAQTTHIDAIPDGEVAKVRDATKRAIEKHGAVKIALGSDSEGGTLEVTDSEQQGSNVGKDFIWWFFRCTFDADCGNWQCHFQMP